MPPKKDGPSKKTMDKAATRVIEDKTFGLKNKKKSKKVQAYVESVAKQVKHNVAAKAAVKGKTAEEMKTEQTKKAKEQQAALEREMQALLRATIKQPKLDPGVDPKSVLCEFFKQGCCDKGDKCKFSHDLAVGRRAAKIDLYTDRRHADGEDGKEDTMADWDQEKLEAVVKTKHGAEKAGATRTEIVCKYFLDAIEKEVYGWFWKCPNGDDCKYRHALPPGYVYKSKKDRDLEAAAKAAEAENTVTVEELIEEERKLLVADKLTPVTAESFAAWKEAREKKRAAELETRRAEEAKRTGTKGYGVLSGRALFTYDPSLFVDDDAADADVYSDHGDDEGGAAGASASGGPAGGEGGAAAAAAGAAGAAGVIDESVFLEGGDDLDDIDDDEGEEEEEDEEEDAEEEDEEGAGAPGGDDE